MERKNVVLLLTRKNVSCMNGQYVVETEQFLLFDWNAVREDVRLLWDSTVMVDWT